MEFPDSHLASLDFSSKNNAHLVLQRKNCRPFVFTIATNERLLERNHTHPMLTDNSGSQYDKIDRDEWDLIEIKSDDKNKEQLYLEFYKKNETTPSRFWRTRYGVDWLWSSFIRDDNQEMKFGDANHKEVEDRTLRLDDRNIAELELQRDEIEQPSPTAPNLPDLNVSIYTDKTLKWTINQNYVAEIYELLNRPEIMKNVSLQMNGKTWRGKLVTIKP